MHQSNAAELWRQRREDLMREAVKRRPARPGNAAGLSLLAALLVAGLLLVGASGPARAEVLFTVDEVGDAADGACSVSQGCTLREAILAANASPGRDIIEFDIPDSEDPGVKTISPTSALPLITDSVFIDGYSQPGATENTQLVGTDARLLVELDGSNARGSGLNVRGASDVVVRGLVINDFSSNGIAITNGASSVKIEGNFIGTDPSGTRDRGNGSAGVAVLTGSNNNAVGGAPRTAHNLVSGNDGSGVVVNQASSNSVLGNLIGTKKDGAGALGNSQQGVSIVDSSFNTVGREVFGMANTIAFNGEDGVGLLQGTTSVDTVGNRIFNNSLFSNDGLGIDLAGGTESASGATQNDPQDADGGPNGLQNKPAITSARASAGSTTVRGTLNSVPNAEIVVQLFSSPSGNEGKTFRGQTEARTDANGDAAFEVVVPSKVPAGHRVTATASFGANTSEFSAPKSVVAR